MISEGPYVFARTYSDNEYTDQVVIALDLSAGKKELDLGGTFDEGTLLRDAYSGKAVKVENGKAVLDTPFDIVLFELTDI